MRRLTALAPMVAVVLAGCGSTGAPRATVTASSPTSSIPAKLLAEMRPIGAGTRFHPSVTGRPTGGCAQRPGAEEAHLELFGDNRVLLIPGGVGHSAGCYGNAVTTDPTGVVHLRAGATLADLFRAWGEPLTAGRLASFTGRVRYYVAGRRATAVPALTEHAEIVIEVGPYVPPHSSFTFAKGL